MRLGRQEFDEPQTRSAAVLPVAELELGASWCFSPKWTVSGGWAVWSFWDLGLQERVTDFDTSNILGFDGFFVRLEGVF